jgi:hypothetical protein
MSRKFKNIASIILLLIFLLPSVIKLEHHHEHFVYDSKSEKNSQVLYGVCGICNFEFFVFLSDLGDIDLQNETPLADYCNNYNCLYYSNPSQYSYLLRAPPGLQI